jgi:hypothetical protein
MEAMTTGQVQVFTEVSGGHPNDGDRVFHGNWTARLGLNLPSIVPKSLLQKTLGVVPLKTARIDGEVSRADPLERSPCRLYEVREHDPSISDCFAQESCAVQTGYFVPTDRRIIGSQPRD